MPVQIVGPVLVFLALGGNAAAPPSDAAAPGGASAPRIVSGSISDDDYPALAIRDGLAGPVVVGLTVGPDGSVTACGIVQSAHPILDAATCRLITARFRYEPVRDRQGRPVPARVSQRVVWRLPRPDPYPFAPVQFVHRVEARGGAIAGCSAAASGRPPVPVEAVGCRAMLPPPMISWLTLQPVDAAVTMIVTTLPAGAEAPAAEARGRVAFETEAEIAIRADGTIAACRESLRRTPLALPMLELPAHVCDYSTRHPRFEPGAGERRATINVTVFLDRGDNR